LEVNWEEASRLKVQLGQKILLTPTPFVGTITMQDLIKSIKNSRLVFKQDNSSLLHDKI
jgi:ribosomal protein L1